MFYIDTENMLIVEKRQKKTNNEGSKTDGRQNGDCYPS